MAGYVGMMGKAWDVFIPLKEQGYTPNKVTITSYAHLPPKQNRPDYDIPLDDTELCVALANPQAESRSHKLSLRYSQAKYVQWNLSNTDTLGPIKCVLIREVSSF